MKNSIKISSLIVALLGLTIVANAQTTTTTTTTTTSTSPDGVIYSVGAEGGLTTGSAKDLHKWDLGGSIEADIPTVKDFYISINAAYDNFFNNKNSGYSTPDIHLLPVKAGIKYFPVTCFYIQGEAGAAFALNKSDVGFNKTATFIYTPQLGVLLNVGGQNYIDLGVNYESSSKFNSGVDASRVNFFGLRVAYAFTGK